MQDKIKNKPENKDLPYREVMELAKTELNKEKPIGQIDMNKVNNWGGSLSIGHPFGATGARLLTTSANRLIEENGKYAMLSACAAGAHGHAMIIKKYEA